MRKLMLFVAMLMLLTMDATAGELLRPVPTNKVYTDSAIDADIATHVSATGAHSYTKITGLTDGNADLVVQSVTTDTLTLAPNTNGNAWEFPENEESVEVYRAGTNILLYNQDGLMMASRRKRTGDAWNSAGTTHPVAVQHMINWGLTGFADVATGYAALGLTSSSAENQAAYTVADVADDNFPFTPIYQIQETYYPEGYEPYERKGYVFPSGFMATGKFTQRFVDAGAPIAIDNAGCVALVDGGYYPASGYQRWWAGTLSGHLTTRNVTAGNVLDLVGDANSQGTGLLYATAIADTSPFTYFVGGPNLIAFTPLSGDVTDPVIDTTAGVDILVRATVTLGSTVSSGSQLAIGITQTTTGTSIPQNGVILMIWNATGDVDTMQLVFIKAGVVATAVDLSAYYPTDGSAATYRLTLDSAGIAKVYIDGTLRHTTTAGQIAALSAWGDIIPSVMVANGGAGSGSGMEVVISDIVLKNE